jgi:hypothetical protein
MALRKRDGGGGIAFGGAFDSLPAMLTDDEPPIDLPDRIRLPFVFDPVSLASDLRQFAEGDWTRHYVRDNYQGDWTVLPLRAPAGETHPVRMIFSSPTNPDYVDAPLLARAPSFQRALARFECPLRAVRLMRLGPGSLIREHNDHDLDAALMGLVRLHVPVTSEAGVEFRLNGTPVAMNPGDVWYLRLADPHSVVNDGDVERVHLVIDAVMNGWLLQMLRAGVSAARTG